MPPRKKNPADSSVTDYRHADKRKNNPPAGLAAKGRVRDLPRARYAYDPHLPPVLRFDDTGASDRLPELLETARRRPLTAEEAGILAQALRVRQPWLEWAGKREKPWFEVDPVALHIHERVATQAILKLAQRAPLQRSLFADPELDYRQAIQFYQHDVDWANRLILGDSLTVMHSLAQREDLAGKVQMIYIDPPYGIKFASNFQSQVGKRDIKDRPEDLSREPEQIKAYRDTWMLGIHSYLSYLRDRLVVARDLLSTTGSIFVQIGEDNLHSVRTLLDEVFGSQNCCRVICYITTSYQEDNLLANVQNYLLWYAKDKSHVTANSIYRSKEVGEEASNEYRWILFPNGETRTMSEGEHSGQIPLPDGARPYRYGPLTSQGWSETGSNQYLFRGGNYSPGANQHWKSPAAMRKLERAGLLLSRTNSLAYYMFLDFFPISPITNNWVDTKWGFDAASKMYVVQTNTKVIERCLLLTTNPGDLVLDPTCGSGTTAYVAEQWGRRWITIDTSRVALALARQRLLTARYDYYQLLDETAGPAGGFAYKTVPHITLKSIAQNQALDPIFTRYEPLLAENLAALNNALAAVPAQTRAALMAKLAAKERAQGKSSLTDADRRRWLLPPTAWQEWEVPFDADPDWPADLKLALDAYRHAWRQKMDAVNATIAASAARETLVDQPTIVPGVARVSGPFTVEGVQPIEETLDLDSPIGGGPDELETFAEDDPANAGAYLEKMIRLLRQDGVRFPDNKVLPFTRLDPLPNSILHAEGEWGTNGEARRVAVSFGPQYGPLTARQVEESLHVAVRRGYDDIVFAAFTIDGAAQAIIQDDPNPLVRSHLAHIRPDVQMGDLLKDTPGSQLFTVFGLPRVQLEAAGAGEWSVEMQGVDIYDPVNNTITATRADKVAAWFLDSDYDGRTFCITQAFFPDSTAWDKIARALKTSVDPERFAAFSGTKSLPFPPGQHNRVAVKVIDPRGNEVIRVLSLEPQP